MSRSLSIGILGAGALGSLFGGRLAAAGTPVTLVDIDQAALDAIARDGVEIVRGGAVVKARPHACRAEDVVEPPDVWIVLTKSQHTRSALASVQHLWSAETWVVSLQNGLSHHGVLDAFRPASHIGLGITTHPSRLLGPGRVESPKDGYVRLMARDGTAHSTMEQLVAQLDDSGLCATLDPHVMSAIWEKVAFNAAINGLGSVSRCTVDQLGHTPGGRALAHAVVREVLLVAQAAGVQTDMVQTLATVDDAIDHHFGHQVSMLQDLLAGRPTEVEAIQGAVARQAQRFGVQAPLTTALAELVRLCEVGSKNAFKA